MNLQIRDPRAYELAKKLADNMNVTMTEAVIEALKDKLRQKGDEKAAKVARMREIADSLWAKRGPNTREVTKEEIDSMWGHE